jgi:hypothetical protein
MTPSVHDPLAPALSVFLGAGALVLAACGTSSPTPAQPPRPEAAAAAPVAGETAAATELREPNTLEGIYTPAQADRGRMVYENICSNCHTTEDWQDEAFLARWDGESVYRFWTYIYEQMPEGEPPYSLPRQDVSDVLTFILELNGLPPGNGELGSDDDSIDTHWLHWRAPES